MNEWCGWLQWCVLQDEERTVVCFALRKFYYEPKKGRRQKFYDQPLSNRSSSCYTTPLRYFTQIRGSCCWLPDDVSLHWACPCKKKMWNKSGHDAHKWKCCVCFHGIHRYMVIRALHQSCDTIATHYFEWNVLMKSFEERKVCTHTWVGWCSGYMVFGSSKINKKFYTTSVSYYL